MFAFKSFLQKISLLESSDLLGKTIMSNAPAIDKNEVVTKDTPNKVWNDDFIIRRVHLDSLEHSPQEVNGEFDCSFNDLKTLKFGPKTVKGSFDCESNLLKSLEHCPTEIEGDFICTHNHLTSLRDIHKQLTKMNGVFSANNNPIKSDLLGLLLIKGCTGVKLDNREVQKILNKYLPNTKGNKGLIECQSELLDADFEEFADLTSILDVDDEELLKIREAKLIKDKDAKLFFKGNKIRVIIPNSEAASDFFCKDTKWNSIDKKNYVIITNDGRKYVAEFSAKYSSFKDENERKVDLSKVLSKYPEIAESLDTIAKKYNFLPLIKDPSDENYLKALKSDIRYTVAEMGVAAAHFGKHIKILPKVAADYVWSTDKSLISAYPDIFDREWSISKLKSTTHELRGWLTNMIGKVSKSEFEDILKSKMNDSDLTDFIEWAFTSPEREDVYGKWINELPVEDKEKLIAKDDYYNKMLKRFEIDLSDKTKLEMINKKPELIKLFTNPDAKLKQSAQWAEDRIKRQNRGY